MLDQIPDVVWESSAAVGNLPRNEASDVIRHFVLKSDPLKDSKEKLLFFPLWRCVNVVLTAR